MTETETKTFDLILASVAQMDFCNKTNHPHFSPPNGICYYCGHGIYKEIQHEHGKFKWTTGISVEQAGSSLITKCPHCSHSYCD